MSGQLKIRRLQLEYIAFEYLLYLFFDKHFAQSKLTGDYPRGYFRVIQVIKC